MVQLYQDNSSYVFTKETQERRRNIFQTFRNTFPDIYGGAVGPVVGLFVAKTPGSPFERFVTRFALTSGHCRHFDTIPFSPLVPSLRWRNHLFCAHVQHP